MSFQNLKRPGKGLAPPSYSGLRVLLAEDEVMATKLAQGALRAMGITDVVTVEDGERALEVLELEQGQFQLIISDWNMPKLSGLDFLKAVRVRYPHMVFLMLTGNANKEFVINAKKHGVDAYIAKPFSPAQLHKKIEALFRF